MNSIAKSELKILLVDDHPFVREGLISTLSSHDDFVVCGEASTAKEAMKMVAKQAPDVIISDISLEGKSGLELIRDLQDHHPEIPVVVLSMHDEKIYGERALEAGAKGYIMKSARPSTLMRAIRTVHAGKIHISDELSNFILSGYTSNSLGKKNESNVSRLTPREFEILHSIGTGSSPREIAAKFSISIKTVNAHRSNIRHKMGFESFVDLLIYAIRWVESDI